MKYAALVFSVCAACTAGSRTPTSTSTSTPASTSTSTPTSTPDAGEEPLAPSAVEIADVLYPAGGAAHLAECPVNLPEEPRARCLFDGRYAGDSRAAHLAFELFAKHRIVAGCEVEHTMDGGYRGMLHLVPAVPVGADRKHIEWMVDTMKDFDEFFRELPDGEHAVKYRFRPITLRYMRSVNARTPSAYAHDWTVAYNLSGSLFVSGDAARETMFHEIFHLNDAAHGEWSVSALSPMFDAVVRKCGTQIGCLAPYSPNATIVRGGTYYSFQPGNGVREYAAELALRYYREQRAILRKEAAIRPAFKCGPSENARAWGAIAGEFFGGIDRTPSCAK